MKYTPRLLLLLLLFLGSKIVYSDTFTVTSNADNGPGTLREAIELANANGVVVQDVILFNISGSDEASRTITLITELPKLTSKITIDGSSQPGNVFSVSFARVILYLDHYTSEPFNFFFLENVSEINIYGICFKFFENPDAAGGLNYGILLRNASHITVGAPGKGNLFSKVRVSVTNNHWTAINNFVSDIVIQNNVFGLDTQGDVVLRGFIDLFQAENITVGGETPEEGNIFVGASLYLAQAIEPKALFFAKVQHNLFNVNWDGSEYYFPDGGMSIRGSEKDNSLLTKTIVSNNIIANGRSGIALSQLTHKVLVQGNKLGMDFTGQICRSSESYIGINSSTNVTVGGYSQNEENIVGGNIYTPSHGVHIIKNKLSGIIDNSNAIPPIDPFIKILSYDNGTIKGIANANAKIQLYTQECGDFCAFKQYSATTYANADGDWSYVYTSENPPIIATATMMDSSTSAFSIPKLGVNDSAVVTNATCGKSNGSIKGMKIIEGTHFGWYNDNTQQLVSSDTNLVNVPAGNYTLKVTNGIGGCPEVRSFIINDLQLPTILNPGIVITDASCGKTNGTLTGNYWSFGSKWISSNNDSVGTGYFASDLFPGTYYLKLWTIEDTSCNKVYGPFVIKNQNGPTLNFSILSILPASCSSANGSVTGITVSNNIGNSYVTWTDSLDNIVSNSFDLLNQSAGKYRLKYKDEGGCDTITTPYFIIPSIGNINIDTTGKKIIAAGCTITNGAITNVSVTGANNWQWKNTDDNSIASIDLNASYLKPGNYQLIATNNYNCSATSPIITVPQGEFAAISPINPSATNAACGQNNGKLKIDGFTNEKALLLYQWINGSTNDNIGSQLAINSLGAGNYKLMATDTNGCVKSIYNANIIVGAKPQIDKSGVSIINDKCDLKQAGISGLQVNGLVNSPAYSWTDENGLIVSKSLDIKNIGAGTYQLTVEDGEFCIITGEPIHVSNSNIDPLPQYDDLIIPRNTSTTLTLKNFSAGKYLLYADPLGNQLVEENATGNFNTAVLAMDKRDRKSVV